jgi:quinol monooxygenase YgiN
VDLGQGVAYITATFSEVFMHSSSSAPQTNRNPLVEQVSATVKDTSMPFALLVHFEAKEGAGQKLEAAFAKAVAATRRENGCLAYDLIRDAQTPIRYVVYERWQNLAALEAHLSSSHIAALRTEISDLRTGPPVAEVLLPVSE